MQESIHRITWGNGREGREESGQRREEGGAGAEREGARGDRMRERWGSEDRQKTIRGQPKDNQRTTIGQLVWCKAVCKITLRAFSKVK